MPPKKVKKGKKDKQAKDEKQEKAEAKNLLNQLPPEDEEYFSQSAEFEVSELTPEFFNVCNKLVQILMEANRRYEAAKVKKLSDTLFLLHSKYNHVVEENESMRPQVERANIKFQIALELSAGADDVVEELHESLAHAWKIADASQAREQITQKKLEEVLVTCEAKAGKEEAEGDDAADFGKMAKYKNIILRERDRLSGEVHDYEKRLKLQRYYSECLEYVNKNYEDTINKFIARMRVLETDKANLNTKLKQHQDTIEELTDTGNKALSKLDTTAKELQDTMKRLEKKTKDFEAQRFLSDKQTKELQLANLNTSKLTQEVIALKNELKADEELLQKFHFEDRAKENNLKQFQIKLKQLQQESANHASKVLRANKNISSLQSEIMQMKNIVHAKDKDIAAERHRVYEITHLKETIQSERDGLRSEVAKLNNLSSELRHSNLMLSTVNDTLRSDISKLNARLDEDRIIISKAERERLEAQQEMETLQERVEFLKEQIQIKSQQITDLTEKQEVMSKLVFNMKRQLEDCHTTKMMLQRNLETCKTERNQLRIQQTRLNHQIVQLTNELLETHSKINSLKLSVEKLNNEKSDLHTQLRSTNKLLASVRSDLKAMKHKNDDLMKTIESDEKQLRKMANEVKTLSKEKNLTGLQMVRRNDELAALREKYEIVQTAVDKGQTLYQSRLEDIRLLKSEVVKLTLERDNLNRAIESTADMRREIIRLNGALNQERVKVSAMVEDVKVPTGVHRWRVLQGSDPSKLRLIEKLNQMQQKGFQRDVMENNLKLQMQATRHEADEMKRYTKILPTNDLGRKLILEQRVNMVRTRQLKAALAELNVLKVELKANYCKDRKLNAKPCPSQDSLDSLSPKPPVESMNQDKLYDFTCIESSESYKKTISRPSPFKLPVRHHKLFVKALPKKQTTPKKPLIQIPSESDGCSQYPEDVDVPEESSSSKRSSLDVEITSSDA